MRVAASHEGTSAYALVMHPGDRAYILGDPTVSVTILIADNRDALRQNIALISMLDPEKLNYLEWQIPDGNCVRLTLLQEEDVELLHKGQSQVDISYLTSRPIQHLSLEEQLRQFREKIPCRFAIRRITDNQFIGHISLFDFNIKNRSVKIGYFTGSDYRRQGYTKEGLGLLLNYLFQTVGLNKVMADTGVFNQASISLLRSVSFRQDGCLRQHQLLDGVLSKLP